MAKRPDLSHISSTLHALALPIEDVFLDPANARQHGSRSIESLCASLKRFGQQVPILADDSGCVVKGNGTLEAAKALGWKHIAVVRTALQGADRTAYAIADNRVGELSDFDIEALARQLTELEDYVGDASLGFTESEVEAMTNSWNTDEALADVKDYDTSTNEFYTIKIQKVAHDDKDDILGSVNELLGSQGGAYRAEAF